MIARFAVGVAASTLAAAAPLPAPKSIALGGQPTTMTVAAGAVWVANHYAGLVGIGLAGFLGLAAAVGLALLAAFIAWERRAAAPNFTRSSSFAAARL